MPRVPEYCLPTPPGASAPDQSRAVARPAGAISLLREPRVVDHDNPGAFAHVSGHGQLVLGNDPLLVPAGRDQEPLKRADTPVAHLPRDRLGIPLAGVRHKPLRSGVCENPDLFPARVWTVARKELP